jgi:Carboxypeptidase regulatory-like domain
MSRFIHVARWCTLVALMIAMAAPLSARQGPRIAPERASGSVTLPIADYDRLLDRAAQPTGGGDQPPIAAVVARAELTGRVDGDVARGTLRLDGEVFQRGAVKVPLVSGATLAEGRADGRTLPLLQEGDSHSGILTGPAPFVVTLDWTAAVEPTPGRVSVLLPQASSGTGTASLDLPGDPGDVRVEPGLLTDRQAANGRTVVRLTLTPGARTRVSWSVREAVGQAVPVEVRTLGEVKSLITIGDGDLRLSSLVDVTVVRGEPRDFQIELPAGYEPTSVTGATLDRFSVNGRIVSLTVREPERRRHQFVLTLEQPHAAGSFRTDTSFPTIAGVQRESGEVLIEGGGTLQVTPDTDDTVRRMDVREAHAALRSMARQPTLAAFRYQRRPGEPRRLALDVTRFADAPVLSAIAERASATTLVTSEGRMLTEMTFVIRNRAQPFMKVSLPAGASILSSEVAGETARPVTGADGTRVPLLRTGFRPNGPYTVSIVYLHGAQPLEKKGDAQMALATVDIPISVLDWELFLPEQYSAKPIAGNVIPVRFDRGMPAPAAPAPPPIAMPLSETDRASPGEIIGRVTDPVGAVLPGVTVTLIIGGRQRQVTTGADGMYRLSGVPVGQVNVKAALAGFMSNETSFTFEGEPRRVDIRLDVSARTETVQVAAESVVSDERRNDARTEDAVQQAPPQNIVNMQRKVAGVLPVRVDVPRAGMSYRFVRPLVLSEETSVSFRYKRK